MSSQAILAWQHQIYGPQNPPSSATSSPILQPQGTLLFDQVRAQFNEGIATLENLLRYMEFRGTADCKDHAKGIDNLLGNMVELARWLVGFLNRSTACQRDSLWTRSAIIGLRVELHRYSWKVMRISMLLKGA